MLGSNVNPHPLLLIINYWEIRPSLIGARLDDLLKRGVTQVCTFIPWQSAESDISHSLTRFLQALTDRRMIAYLILSPEVGVHYPNSGLPKDVITRKENMAQHAQSGLIPINLPPNSFTLPSFYAPEFSKRYYSFLARLDSLFSDLERSQPSLLKGVTAVLTGSFWKYYRSAAKSAQTPFGGTAGDYSSHAAVVYRQRSELFFSQREFTSPISSPSASASGSGSAHASSVSASAHNRWNTRSMEEVNRFWFYQQSEDTFRNRSCQVVGKKSMDLKIAEIELFTPEADPGMTYSSFLQMLSGANPDFGKLSHLIEETASRASFAALAPSSPYVHWTSMGSFRTLSDSQKQFLILKSLLLHGGQSGGIAMDEQEWFSLSNAFRTRTEGLFRSFMSDELRFRNRALYLVPHLWSHYGALWDGFFHRIGAEMKMVAALTLVQRDPSASLLIVDPTVILTQETLKKLFAWASPGRVLVLPRSKLYTEAAKTELEIILGKSKKISIEYGLSYNLYPLGDGQLVVYEVPNGDLNYVGASSSALQTFMNSIVALSEIESFCRLSDSRLRVIPFERKTGGLALFVLNGTRRSVAADILFPAQVQISDLGVTLGNDGGLGLPDESEAGADGQGTGKSSIAVANRFSLEVPPYGVLSLTIEGTSYTEMKEKRLAALTSEYTRANVFKAANTELPGFSPGEDLEELWS